jgi:hypothetical protein
MRIQIKDSWLISNKGKNHKLYREYKTFYNKIMNINKLLLQFHICGFKIDTHTEILCKSKIDLYLRQMDILYYYADKNELPSQIHPKSYKHRCYYYNNYSYSYVAFKLSKKDFLKLGSNIPVPTVVEPITNTNGIVSLLDNIKTAIQNRISKK